MVLGATTMTSVSKTLNLFRLATPCTRSVSSNTSVLNQQAQQPALSPETFRPTELQIDIKTKVPGPKSVALKSELNKIQQMTSITLFADYDKSLGNFLTDVDDNTYLDCFMQIASIPLGYNHPNIISALIDQRNLSALANRPATGHFPSHDWAERLQNSMMSAAPAGMTQVFPMMCGTCSNENAIKMIFMRYMHEQRGGRTEFTQEELTSTLKHQSPGSPKLSMLSFSNGFHGRTIGLLSCSNSRPIQGVDIPSLPWPKSSFPHYQYPLEEHEAENKTEDEKCLAEMEDKIVKATESGVPVAGVICEPIQAEGGDYHGSAEFFQGMERICKKYNISLLMDEVQTGGGSTGKMWAHEHFGISPDVVTFSKKMMSGGIFHKLSHKPPHPGRIMNTWMGDPHKIVLLEQVIRTIKEDNLLELVRESGKVMLTGLKELQSRYPGILSKARGLGTMCAVDVKDAATRDKLLAEFRQNGIHLGGCGDATIRFRPSLIFAPSHTNLMLDNMDSVLQKWV